MGHEITIAIDGPGSSGKGTVARAVARALGYAYVDTGAMYRSVALLGLERGLNIEDEDQMASLARSLDIRFTWDGDVLRVALADQDVTRAIRAEAVGQGASQVSALPAVRQALLDRQRELAAAGGVVMDGRDIGTVVLPDAQLKVFLDADLDERARRRHEEILRRGETTPFEVVRSELHTRDERDRGRTVAPLRPAQDAVIVDSTEMTIRQAVDRVLSLAQERRRVVDTGADPQ